MNFVVLSSSRGTVFQATIDRLKDGSLQARCLGLVCDRPDHGCVEKARAAGLTVKIVPMRKGEPREDYDKRLHQAILELCDSDQANRSPLAANRSIIACMGWMWVLSPWFVRKWPNRILNVHPALLPKHPGAHAHELVLAAKDKESGMTIHLIDEGVDTGKILIQKSCPVLPDDTVDTLKARVQKLEIEWFPKVLEMVEKGEIKLP
jgi:formyltetrahydrofolate-dependent phosphoribosylglycinamide formyltransferase